MDKKKNEAAPSLTSIMEGVANSAAALVGLRKQLIDGGYSEHGAEQIIAAMFMAQGQR